MAELYETIMSVKLFIIVIIDFKCYPSTYCLVQGFIYSNFQNWKNIYLKIRITTFNYPLMKYSNTALCPWLPGYGLLSLTPWIWFVSIKGGKCIIHTTQVWKCFKWVSPQSNTAMTDIITSGFYIFYCHFIIRAFHWQCEHSTTELPSHPVISQTSFHLKSTPVTVISSFVRFVKCLFKPTICKTLAIK